MGEKGDQGPRGRAGPKGEMGTLEVYLNVFFFL